MSTPTTHRTAPLWKFAEVSPSTPEFNDLTESDEVTFIPLEDVWPANKADDFQTVAWEKRLTGYTPFRRGDLLLPKVTPTVTHGRTMITDTATELGVASTEVYTVRARPGTDPRWLAYLLVGTEFLGLAGASVQGTGGLKRISTQFVESYPLPDASPDEQRAIADYLDRETAEVDAMSADLDEMEALLKERRISVAALHIFGADLDSYPRLSLKMVTSQTFAGEWGKEEGELEVDRQCVRVADFDRQTNMVNDEVPTVRSYTEKNVREKSLRTGDLLIEKSGGTNINPVGNVIEYVGPDGPLCSNFIQVVRLNNQQHPRYWQQAHLAAYQTGITNLHVHQTTGIQNLDMTSFTSEKYPVPPLDDQRRIAAEIDRETAEIDAMLADITELRDFLAERRAAIIAAAVTGQIDVPTPQETTNG